MKTKLEARVDAANRCRHYSNLFAPQLIEIFKPYVGKKVLVADGSFVTKLREALKSALSKFEVSKRHLSISSSKYSLCFRFSTYTLFNGYAYHQDVSLYLGDLDGDILKSVTLPEPCKTDYKASEVEADRAEFKRLEKLYEAAKSKLGLFGERD